MSAQKLLRLVCLGISLLGLTIANCIPSYENNPSEAPIAHVKNGSYYGFQNSHYNIDYFLGMPFAQPPINELRLQKPQSLNESWAGIRNATEFGYACVGYGSDTWPSTRGYLSEDCLTLNVYRPSGVSSSDQLPVLVWIYGGGFIAGSCVDQRYNLTFLVEQSAKIDKPIIAVSINYRLQGWGFLWSEEIVQAGISNLGFRDQRLALQWVQENIDAFGGDPSKVTIWGESAGARDVGVQLMAFNGRDDNLFRSAISDSGAMIGFGVRNPSQELSEAVFQNLTEVVGCGDAPDKIGCLRDLSFDTLNDALNDSTIFDPTGPVKWGPVIDYDIIARDPVEQFLDGDYIQVPYIIGTNSDEGTEYVDFGVNTEDELEDALASMGLPNSTFSDLMELYPINSPDLAIASHSELFNETIGLQWKRLATIGGDLLMVAPTRLTCERWVNQTDVPIYNYRFNTIPEEVDQVWSVTHGSEVAFVFHNLKGVGYPEVNSPIEGNSPFSGAPPGYFNLTDIMSRMWISFIYYQDPNYSGMPTPFWPPYSTDNPSQIVFDGNISTYIALDDLRSEQIGYIIDNLMVGESPS